MHTLNPYFYFFGKNAYLKHNIQVSRQIYHTFVLSKYPCLMEQKQFDYGVELCDPESISSSTKGQLFETLETDKKLNVLQPYPSFVKLTSTLCFVILKK